MMQVAVPYVTERFKVTTLADLAGNVCNCARCSLHSGATNHVPGEGNPLARLMLVGEGPGAQEDLQGRPFVGAAGQLLDKILNAISLSREDVFIANIVKCRPPGNRVPTEEEAAACLPFLLSQIDVIRPKIVVCLGATALRYLVGRNLRITASRGTWFVRDGVSYLPTYHPAALLRDPGKKPQAWEDFKLVRTALTDREVSPDTPIQLRLGGQE